MSSDSDRQSTNVQRDALLAAGVDARHLFEDHASGAKDDRTGWGRVTDHLSVCAGHRSASRRCIACQYALYWLRDAPCAALRWLRAAHDI
ncbi:recombinase family protein [Verminephrobacter eiseniae]